MGPDPDAPRGASPALQAYVALLLKWNRSVNLISRADEAAIWSRHVEDSRQLAALIPPGVDRAIDLGSGAGFPGLILALETGIAFDLAEADQRKAAFLREAVRVTGAPARVHAVRIAQATLTPAPLITARALAPLADLLDLAAPLLAPSGTCLFPKGTNASSELTAASARWHMRVETTPSRTGGGGVILRISEISRVGSSS
ncbi:MAG: 16S rRNA (guanine(527)-N(7))-methyltransferase RsmG [Rhodospirillales bacterium 69-11]|nr:16S rRNA (guanine(527)-N(7))-methyltransferase RsmG [Rhodospirillales bacterium]MBN8925186.1 16S rRNA (guanine(527)-N(7))-methyltransferase RsmG [Rhodospirillales bacterium]OJW24220.1 MAG: 16S rRNA (guanine(527)-N(7))-methyltransferase RsmG [Rhodospirillales bacterium 69-11]